MDRSAPSTEDPALPVRLDAMNEQTWNAAEYVCHAGFVASLGAGLLDVLAPQAGEHVLDLGCGDGALTSELAARGCSVVGVDSSPEQVAHARARGLDARVVDGQALGFEQEFDAVLSNAALHWMKRPAAVLDGVWRSLEPGGRFVGEMGGIGNVASVVEAAHSLLAAAGIDSASCNPWYFPSVDTYQGLLTAQGFELDFIMLFRRPTPLDGDVSHWLRLFAQSFAAAVPEARRADFHAALRARLAPRLMDAAGRWCMDYVRLRFKVRKPA